MNSVLVIFLIGFGSLINGYSDLCFGLPNGIRLKNPDTDELYYECENNEALEYICDDSQKAILAGCKNNDNSGITETTTTTPNPHQSICEDEDDNLLIPHPDNCEQFFFCMQEIPILGTCPGSQHFDPTDRVCVDPEDSTCIEPNPVCKDRPNGTLLPVQGSCTDFFICQDNVATQVECPFGLYFDIDLGCTSPDNTVCPPETTTEMTTTAEPFNDACVGQEDAVLVEHSTDCDKFYFCFNEEALTATCPSGSYFNPEHRMCDTNFDCPDKPVNVCYNQDDFTFVNDPTECANYFICFNGEPSRRTCPGEMQFNPITSACDLAEVVRCDFETTTSTSTEETTTPSSGIPDSCPPTGDLSLPNPLRCSTFTLCTLGLELQLACQSDFHFNFGAQACLPRDEAGCTIPIPVCDAITPGPLALVHPQYCDRFFVCFNGQMQPFQCAAGQHFDVVNQDCLPWQQVGCESL